MTKAFQVTGVGAVPAAGVSAVQVQIVAINGTASTWLTLWPDGGTKTVPSMLNVASGVTLSNSATIPVGSNGKIDVFNNAGSVNVIVNVYGYYTTSVGSGTSGGFVRVPHTALVSTRSGLGTAQATIPGGGSRTVTLTGSLIPADANAVYVDLIVTDATVQGWMASDLGGTTTHSAAINYVVGTSAFGTVVKLGAGGQVTFVNGGTGAVNLLVVAEGYFTSTPNKGGGYRFSGGRLLDTGSTLVPANGFIDVQVGGALGLPTRGIAGAVLNLTTDRQSASGYLAARPLGASDGAVSVAHFPSGVGRADQVVVTPGTEGKIRINNVSSGSIRLIVDLEGWFADPLPTVPVEQFSRITAIQASPLTSGGARSIEYVAADNIGRLRHGHQADSANFGDVVWTTISDGQAFTGQPGLVEQADGKAVLAAQQVDSNIWARAETSKDPLTWGAWSAAGGSMASHPVSARLGDLVEVFAVDADGRLWYLPQTATNAAFGSWHSLGDVDLAGTPAVVAVQDGLQLVGVDTAGHAKTAKFTTGGALSAWTDLGGSLTGTPAVVVAPGFALRIVALSGDGTVVTRFQDTSGSWSPEWTPVGSFTAAGSPAAVLSPVTGRVEILARGTDDSLYSTGETTLGSGAWRAWQQETFGETVAGDPSILEYATSGSHWLVLFLDSDSTIRFLSVTESASAAASPSLTDGANPTAKTPAPPEFTAHTLMHAPDE